MDWKIFFFLFGRFLLAGFFLFNALNHFKNYKGMAEYAKSYGVPMPTLAVLGSGGLLLVTGLSFLTGLYPTIGVASAALFLVPVSVMMHPFWKMKDPGSRAAQYVQFNKNMAILGATLMLLMVSQPWEMSLTF